MQTSTETERKYDVPTDFALPELPFDVGEPQTHRLVAAYLDTDDLRLAGHRMTLRRRTGGTDAGWHLKTPGSGDGRTEHRMPIADDLPAELAARIRAVVRDRPVTRVAELRTTRVEHPVLGEHGRVLALIADDTVEADAGDGVQRWREIEVELVEGSTDVLDAVQRELLAAGATAAAGPSKLGRVLGARVPAAPPRPDHPVVAYVAAQRDAIVANDPGARDGDEDAVHDMRVAIRRLRSTLKTWPGYADRTALRDELRWVAERLGAVRDAQVMARRLDGLAAEFPEAHDRIGELIAGDLAAGCTALATALDEERYLRVLDALDDLAAARAGAGKPRRAARRALRRAERKLAAANGEDAGLHEARKAYKRARYAAEVLGKPAKPLVSAITAIQDVLGTHQDAVITAAALREYADRATGHDTFAYGVLHERQRLAAAEALTGLRAARKAAHKARGVL